MDSNSNIKRVDFTGTGGDFFKLSIVNIILTMLTLGIYFFWAKVRTKKFFYQNTVFMDGRFEYHVSGMEKFIAFIKAAVFLGIIYAVFFGIGALLGFLGVDQAIIAAALPLLFMLLFALVAPVLEVARRRFTMSRSSWNNIHFGFTGQVKPLFVIMLKGLLLSVLTFGVYIPWYYASYMNFITSNTRLGSSRFGYSGKPGEILKLLIPAYVAFLLYLGFIIGFGVMAAQAEQGPRDPAFALIFFFPFAAVFVFLFAMLYIVVALFRYNWNHTHFQDCAMGCDLTFGKYLGRAVAGYLLVPFTLGLALPWVVVMLQGLMIRSVYMIGEPDLDRINAVPDEESSAFAEALGEAGDALDAIADFLG